MDKGRKGIELHVGVPRTQTSKKNNGSRQLTVFLRIDAALE